MTLVRQSHKIRDLFKGLMVVIFYISHSYSHVACVVLQPDNIAMSFLKQFVEHDHFKKFSPSGGPMKLSKPEK